MSDKRGRLGHPDFEIVKWGGPNQFTGGTHWELRHLPTGRRLGDFKRKRDAEEMLGEVVPLAEMMRQYAEMGPGEGRRELATRINDVWLSRRGMLGQSETEKGDEMNRYRFSVIVEAPTLAQAQLVMNERMGYDEEVPGVDNYLINQDGEGEKIDQ